MSNLNSMNSKADTKATPSVHMAELSRATAQAAAMAGVDSRVDVNHFRPYDSQLPVPEVKGYRTVKIIYRENKATGKKAGDTSFIRVPDWMNEQIVADNLAELMPHFLGYLQTQEDEIIKAAHKEGESYLKPENFGVAQLLEAMNASTTTSRVNAEKIGEWFRDNMVDALALAFSEKMGLSEEPTAAEMEKLLTIVTTYENKLKSLASPKTHYRKEEVELLQKALEVTGAKDTFLGERFYSRLEGMKDVKANDLLMSL